MKRISFLFITIVMLCFLLSSNGMAEENRIHVYFICEAGEYPDKNTDLEAVKRYELGDSSIGTDENDGWIKTDNGYIETKNCMISVKDFIPNIECDIKNSYSSAYISSSEEIFGVTGEKLYYFAKQNEDDYKDKDDAYAVLKYSAAVKLKRAEEIAESKGYRLKIYDSYRPRSVTLRIRDALDLLCQIDDNVKKNIVTDKDGNTWGMDYFLARETSSHNYGCAVDLTLVDSETNEEVEMPCAVHELSTLATKMISPGSETMREFKDSNGNDNVRILNDIMKEAGFDGLSSEFWHYQDNESMSEAKNVSYNGFDFN